MLLIPWIEQEHAVLCFPCHKENGKLVPWYHFRVAPESGKRLGDCDNFPVNKPDGDDKLRNQYRNFFKQKTILDWRAEGKKKVAEAEADEETEEGKAGAQDEDKIASSTTSKHARSSPGSAAVATPAKKKDTKATPTKGSSSKAGSPKGKDGMETPVKVKSGKDTPAKK